MPSTCRVALLERFVMEIKVNIDEVITALGQQNKNFDNAVKLATNRVGMLAVRIMKEQVIGAHSLGTPRSSGKNIVAGHPSNVTGNLQRSVTNTVSQGFFGQYIATVGPIAAYAYDLEVAGVGKDKTQYKIVEPTGNIMSSNSRAVNIYMDAMRRALGK